MLCFEVLPEKVGGFVAAIGVTVVQEGLHQKALVALQVLPSTSYVPIDGSPTGVLNEPNCVKLSALCTPERFRAIQARDT